MDLIEDGNLDETFIGQWEIVRLDDYLSPKAGMSPVVAVVRSRKDLEAGTVTLYSTIHQKFRNDPILMDGSVGIMGRITERYEACPPAINRTEVLYLHCVPGKEVLDRTKIDEGRQVIDGSCEFDDICWKHKVLGVRYYIEGGKTRYLHGLKITIPIDMYNNYVRMRDLWYKDYKGCQSVKYPSSGT